MLRHVELFVHKQPKVLLPKASLAPFSVQPVLVLGIALTQVQDLALGLVELHKIHTGPPFKPVHVPLDAIPSVLHVDCTTQLGVVSKIAEGALNPTVDVTKKDVKLCQCTTHVTAFHLETEPLTTTLGACHGLEGEEIQESDVKLFV